MTQRSHRTRHRRVWIVAATLLAATAAGTVNAAPAPGFVDGEWTGTFVWNAKVVFPDAFGSGESTGTFTAQFIGGTPTGSFTWVAPSATGTTTQAQAKLKIEASGAVGGTATAPLLVPEGALVTGEVIVPDIGKFPVNFSLSAGEMTSAPLDIVTADCTKATGSMTTHIEVSTDLVASAGGSLSVSRADWAAWRLADNAATEAGQSAAIDQLLADGIAMGQAVADGTFDDEALRQLLYRAEQFAGANRRGAPCGLGQPGHFTTVVAGVVSTVIEKMVLNEAAFDVGQFLSAISAGVEAGAIGSSAGPAGAALTLDVTNVLWSKYSAAAAAGNFDDLVKIAQAAAILGNEDLLAQALASADKP